MDNHKQNQKDKDINPQSIKSKIEDLKDSAPNFDDVRGYCDNVMAKVDAEQKHKTSTKTKYYVIIAILWIAVPIASYNFALEKDTDTNTDRIYSTLYHFEEGQKFTIMPYQAPGDESPYTAESLTFSIIKPDVVDSCDLKVEPIRINGGLENERHIITFVTKDGEVAPFTPAIIGYRNGNPKPYNGGCVYSEFLNTSIHWSGIYYYSQFLRHLSKNDLYFKIELINSFSLEQ